MKTRFLTLLVLAGLFLRPVGSSAQPSQADQVRASAVRVAFDRYMNAALAHDGATVAALVSKNTIASYARYQQLALYGSKDELLGLNPYERFSVLHLRHRLPAEALAGMTPLQILQESYDKGWNSKKALETIQSLGDAVTKEIVFTGLDAAVHLKLGDNLLPPPLPMKLEEGGWKVDMAGLFPYSNEKLEKSIAAKGVSADEFLLDMLTTATGTKPSPQIWDPPLKN